MSYHGTVSGMSLGAITAPTRAQNDAATAAKALILTQLSTVSAAWLPLSTAIAPVKQMFPLPDAIVAFWSKMTGKDAATLKAKQLRFATGSQLPTPGATSKAGWVNGDVTWDTWIETDGSRILRVRGYNPVTLPMMVAQAANAWAASNIAGAAKAVTSTATTATKAVSTALQPVIEAVASTTRNTTRAVTTAITSGGTRPASTSNNAANLPSSTPTLVYDDELIAAQSNAIAKGTPWWPWAAGVGALGVVGYFVLRKKRSK